MEVRLDDLVFQAQAELMIGKPECHIVVEYVQEPENEQKITVLGEEVLLKTVFINLLDNACKYSPNHHALVMIDFTDTCAVISILDVGIGIPPEDMQNIFEPFYRSKNALNMAGFGIGLSICRKIVELHRGRIYVTSKLLEGSTFVVELPNIFINGSKNPKRPT